MGQKVNPHGLRVGIIKNWDSRWFARDDVFGDTLVEDYQLRKFLKKKFYDAGVPNIEIERDAARVRIHIHCARPGVVIGKGGVEIEKTRKACEEIINKNREQKLAVYLNVVEVRQIDKNAQLVAENIAQQLENRVSFRRAMKQAIGRAMRFGARGIKVQVSGRLGGAEIARTEHYHEGTIPLQTLRADIDYGFAEAATTYGRIGVKVWIYEGEVLGEVRSERPRNPRQPRRDNRDRRDARPPRSDNRPPRSDNRLPGQREGGPSKCCYQKE
jgi:small subunit ribosomal protein S3